MVMRYISLALIILLAFALSSCFEKKSSIQGDAIPVLEQVVDSQSQEETDIQNNETLWEETSTPELWSQSGSLQNSQDTQNSSSEISDFNKEILLESWWEINSQQDIEEYKEQITNQAEKLEQSFEDMFWTFDR